MPSPSAAASPTAPHPEEIARLHAEMLASTSSPPPATEARSFVAAARSALELGRLDDALSLARAALAVAPNNAQAWVVAGDACWSVHDVVGARRAWEEALAFDDKDHATAISCARAQLMTGAVNAARALLTFVITRSSSVDVRDAALALLETIDNADTTSNAAVGSRS